MRKLDKTQTIGEEIANAISHGLMALFGIFSMIMLLFKADNTREIAGAIIFGLSIVLLYTMSTLYHSFRPGVTKRVFKRFDHLSIYILIGGTFAPALLTLDGLKTPFLGINGFLEAGLLLFIIQWTLIIVGIVFKSIWIKKYAKLHLVLYLLMGWSSLMFAHILFNESGMAFLFILLGGISYSIGVIFYVLSKYKYFHFIWHIFTSLGTILQFVAIYHYLY